MFQAVKRDIVWGNGLYSIYDAKALLTPSAYSGVWGNLFDKNDVGGQLWLVLPQQTNTQEAVEAVRCVGTWDEVTGILARIRGPSFAMGPKTLAERLNMSLEVTKRHRRGKKHRMRVRVTE